MRKINFNKASMMGDEMDYIESSIKNAHISGGGNFTERCNNLIEQSIGVQKSLLTTSCTHSLEMISILLDIKNGDEIILPSYTFVSTANAFVMRGAKPVFVDVRNDTLNMDESKIEKLISKNTKAIIPVHYGGVGCEMDAIKELVSGKNIYIVEDNAHGLFAKYKGRYLGTFGDFCAQSFHETKNFTCGEGGALIINSKKFINRAEIIIDKGTNRKQFFQGEVEKYSWVDIGSSYRLSELLAAYLFAQLECREKIQSKRKMIWEKYYESLLPWADKNDIRMPFIPDHCESSYHLFHLLLPNKKNRNRFINHLKQFKIHAVFHYVPLHNSIMSGRNLWDRNPCPVSSDVSERLVRLPLYYGLSENDLSYIIEKIQDFHVD